MNSNSKHVENKISKGALLCHSVLSFTLETAGRRSFESIIMRNRRVDITSRSLFGQLFRRKFRQTEMLQLPASGRNGEIGENFWNHRKQSQKMFSDWWLRRASRPAETYRSLRMHLPHWILGNNRLFGKQSPSQQPCFIKTKYTKAVFWGKITSEKDSRKITGCSFAIPVWNTPLLQPAK